MERYLIQPVIRSDVVEMLERRLHIFWRAAELEIIVLTHGQRHGQTEKDHGQLHRFLFGTAGCGTRTSSPVGGSERSDVVGGHRRLFMAAKMPTSATLQATRDDRTKGSLLMLHSTASSAGSGSSVFRYVNSRIIARGVVEVFLKYCCRVFFFFFLSFFIKFIPRVRCYFFSTGCLSFLI